MSIFNGLWEWSQNRQIAEADQKATRAENIARRETDELRDRIDSLTLTCAAMWSILSERIGVTEAQLLDRMKQLDLADGRVDGRFTPASATCSSCKRRVVPTRGRCVYCGTVIAGDSPFMGTAKPPPRQSL